MDLLAELRRRLDVPEDLVSDELLRHLLDVSAGLIQPWLSGPVPWLWLSAPVEPEESPDPALAPLIDEATVELAVKVYDVSPRGVATMDAGGEWILPSPSATPGLVRSVFGVLGPALATGGISV